MEKPLSDRIKKKPSNLNLSNTHNDDFNMKEELLKCKPLIKPTEKMVIVPQNFKKIKDIGRGAQGEVALVQYIPTNETYAMKTMTVVDKELLQTVLREIEVNQMIDHPNLVKYWGCYIENDRVSIIMEYMGVGSLASLIPYKLPEPIISYIARQILQGLSYLNHVKKILHRDIKPANILINSQGEIKIADFGISKVIDSTVAKTSTFVGSKVYMSPERLDSASYTVVSDVWSFGVTIYELAWGKHPFGSYTGTTIFDMILIIKDKDTSQFPPEFSPKLASFLSKALRKDPAYRIRSTILLGDEFITDYKNIQKEDFLAAVKAAVK